MASKATPKRRTVPASDVQPETYYGYAVQFTRAADGQTVLAVGSTGPAQWYWEKWGGWRKAHEYRRMLAQQTGIKGKVVRVRVTIAPATGAP